MPTLGYDDNPIGRRKLAAKLLALMEHKHPSATFGFALMTINAHMSTFVEHTEDELWEKWAEIGDFVRTEEDERTRKIYEFMFAMIGTALEEITGRVNPDTSQSAKWLFDPQSTPRDCSGDTESNPLR